jgi:DNA (cytosine-5)-methyltransferase 1
MKKFRVLSLFSGIGGLDLGLENTKAFKTVAFCEVDLSCQLVLNRHWSRIPIFRDVKNLGAQTNMNSATNFTPLLDCVDIIVGGFPCQDISVAGKKKGIINGERSSLWKEYARIINEVKPKYAIIENVEYLRKNGLGVVLNDLARIGYDAEWYTLTATGVCNLPHQRKRLFIIAYPRSERCDEYSREEGHLQTNKERENSTIHSDGEKQQLESQSFCPILSREFVDNFRNSYSSRQSSLSNIRRVTDGIPQGLDEQIRKQRIKQLGNSVVPAIAEMLGLAILQREENGLKIKSVGSADTQESLDAGSGTQSSTD